MAQAGSHIQQIGRCLSDLSAHTVTVVGRLRGGVRPGIDWRNVPVPEPHAAGLLVGFLLHQLQPWWLPVTGSIAHLIGGGLAVVGIAVGAWAVTAPGRERLDDPTALVIAGPYRHSRHPMYVGWTACYVGVAVAARWAWPLALLPGVAAWTHLVVRREERRLAAAFGDDYRLYCREVRRYI